MELLSTSTYRILPNKRTPLINAPPIVWPSPKLLDFTKMTTVSLIMVRFSIRNHHWKAENVSYHTNSLVLAPGAFIRENTVFGHRSKLLQLSDKALTVNIHFTTRHIFFLFTPYSGDIKNRLCWLAYIEEIVSLLVFEDWRPPMHFRITHPHQRPTPVGFLNWIALISAHQRTLSKYWGSSRHERIYFFTSFPNIYVEYL